MDPRGGFSKFCAIGFRFRRGHRHSRTRDLHRRPSNSSPRHQHIICDARCYFTDLVEPALTTRSMRSSTTLGLVGGLRSRRCITRRLLLQAYSEQSAEKEQECVRDHQYSERYPPHRFSKNFGPSTFHVVVKTRSALARTTTCRIHQTFVV